MKKFLLQKNKGSAMLISVIYFMFISLAAVSGIASPLLKTYKDANVNLNSKKAYFLAESGVEDAVYRLKNSMQIGTEENLSLDGNTVTTNISSPSANEKSIVSLGDVSNYNRSLGVNLTTDVGVSFNYGVQVGSGGLHLDSGVISGNVYANGPITATSSGSNRITGHAISANSPSLTADQSHGSGSPSYNVVFANNNATQDIGQSFQIADDTLPLNKVEFYIRKVNSPSDATVTIRNDSSGSPGTTILATGTLPASTVTTSYGWIPVSFTTNPILQLNTTYWLVIDASTNASNYYNIGANSNSYASGVGKIGRVGSSWSNTTPSGLDYFFRVYLGGINGSIIGNSQWTQLPIGASSGDARAHTVNYVTTPGSIYCQSGTGNNKSCSSATMPVYIEFPVSDANIEAWQAEAEAGGTHNGNYTVGWAGATLGPKKINGNLTVSGGGVLTMTGNLWVTGNIEITGGATVKLNHTYGQDDGVIIANGTVLVSGGGNATGSGTSGSYIMLLTTNTGTSAFTVSGGAGAMIAYAHKGTMTVTGGTSLKETVAHRLVVSDGSSVTYETGLTNNNFSSGPSGTWSVNSWKEE
jgi:hypothetical protein